MLLESRRLIVFALLVLYLKMAVGAEQFKPLGMCFDFFKTGSAV